MIVTSTLRRIIINKKIFDIYQIIHSWQPKYLMFEVTYFMKDELGNDVIETGLNQKSYISKKWLSVLH